MGFNKREEISKEMLGFTFIMHEKKSKCSKKNHPQQSKNTVHQKEKELYMVPKYHNEVIQKV